MRSKRFNQKTTRKIILLKVRDADVGRRVRVLGRSHSNSRLWQLFNPGRNTEPFKSPFFHLLKWAQGCPTHGFLGFCQIIKVTWWSAVSDRRWKQRGWISVCAFRTTGPAVSGERTERTAGGRDEPTARGHAQGPSLPTPRTWCDSLPTPQTRCDSLPTPVG